MIKVLFIHHGGSFGGAIFSLLAMVKSLDQSRFSIKVLFLVPDEKSLEMFQSEGINAEFVDESFYLNNRYYFIHSEVGNNKWYSIVSLYKTIVYWRKSANIYAQKVLQREKPDILHLNSSVLTDWSFAAKKLNIKNIIHIREPLASGYLGLRKRIFRGIVSRNSDYIIAISEDNAKRVNLLSKTYIMYNQVLVEEKKEPIQYNTKTILFAGGIDVHKGFVSFAKAIPLIDKSIKILILGNLNASERKIWQPSFYKNRKVMMLYNRIKELPNVHILGNKSNIYDYISQSTITLSYFSKPHFSRLVLESYLFKKPVIGSDVKGMDEIVKHGITGFIVPKDDFRKLAETINTICFDFKKAEKMGKAGNLFYKSKFLKNNKLVCERIYNSVLINKEI